MSRPRHYYIPIVKRLYANYPDKLGSSAQSSVARYAIDRAINETLQLPDGDIRLELMERIYRRGQIINTAAEQLNISERTAQRWSGQFLERIARYAGYVD